MAKKVKKAIKSIGKTKKMGRPPIYDKAKADELCLLIATTSKGLQTLCKMPGMPSFTTVFSWLSKQDEVADYKDFANNYARAREAQADFLASQTVELSDEERRTDTVFQGGEASGVTSSDNTQRTRLQIDARKWMASKLAPKKYGDKLDVTSEGSKLTSSLLSIEIIPPTKE